MSESDSFIDEVTEEVRRDRLYASFRKYGWIGVVAVLLIVGGAAWKEWSIVRAEARARAFGDAVAAALANQDAAGRLAALKAIDTGKNSGEAMVLALLTGSLATDSGQPDEALVALRAVSDNPAVPDTYRQLAKLKEVMAGGSALPADERDRILAELAVPGQPYRPLALELQGIALADAGKVDEAAAIFTALLQDAEASGSVKARAQEMLNAIGRGAPAES